MSESVGTFKWIRSFVMPGFFGNIFKRPSVTTSCNTLPSDCHAKGNHHRAIISKAAVSAGASLSCANIPHARYTIDVQRDRLTLLSVDVPLADLEFTFTIVVGQSRVIYGIGKSRSLIYSTTGRYSKESTHADYKVYGRAVTLLLLRYEALPVFQG